MSAIHTEALRKVYDSKAALDCVDLDVAEGQVFGFLGRNGAGKTTTIRVLLGLARPTSGSASIFGQDVTRAGNDVRSMIGYLPDVPGYHGWMRADELMTFTGRLFGLDRDTIAERSQTLLDMAGLKGVQHKVGGFSRGMKQRLGIAQALMNAPRLLILDEPTSALDPQGRKEVLDMIDALRGRTTVFFSTHILTDVERVCDEVAILDEGRVVVQSGLEELKQRFGGGRRLLLEVDGIPRSDQVDGTSRSSFIEELGQRPWATRLEETTSTDGQLVVHIESMDDAAREVPELCVRHRMALRRFEPFETSLEDVFLDLITPKESR